MKKLSLFFTLYLFSSLCFGQNVENDYFKKIQVKIDNDDYYLNMYRYDNFKLNNELIFIFERFGLQDTITFPKSNLYKIKFIKNPSKNDEIIILDIETTIFETIIHKKTRKGQGPTQTVTYDSSETKTILYSFKYAQIYEIQDDSIFKDNFTNKLLKEFNNDYVGIKKSANISAPPLEKVIDGIQNIDGLTNTLPDSSKGFSSENNLQFLQYNYLNNNFYYPKEKEKIVNSGWGVNTNQGKSNIHLNLNFSKITFQHSIMRKFFGDSDDNDGLSLEISTEEKIMNIVPWTSLSTTIAGRTLFMLRGEETKVEDKYYLDTRIFYKLRTNTAELVKDLPFVVADDPKLNFSNRLGIEFNMTRELALPYLNFYLALGAKEFNDPYVGFYENGQIYSYFTMTQARAVMSFYWNTSGDDVHRFRLDLGGVYYDKFKVLYDLQSPIQNNSNIDIKDLDLKVSDIQKQDGQIFPMIEIHFNFVPNKNKLFGVSLRAFDNIGRLSGWLKLLDFDNAVLRFEATYISQPLGRKPREWETKGGTIMQLNYRYGM